MQAVGLRPHFALASLCQYSGVTRRDLLHLLQVRVSPLGAFFQLSGPKVGLFSMNLLFLSFLMCAGVRMVRFVSHFLQFDLYMPRFFLNPNFPRGRSLSQALQCFMPIFMIRTVFTRYLKSPSRSFVRWTVPPSLLRLRRLEIRR